MFGFAGKIQRVAKQFLELSEDGILIFNQNMELVFINKKAETIFGYQGREVLGKSIKIFIPERFHMQHGVFVEEFARQPVTAKAMSERTRKIYASHRDGHEFLTNIAIIKSDVAGRHFIAVIRNSNISVDDDRELIRIAVMDPLTGVLNKNEFLSLAEKESLRSKRYSRPFSVALLRLDVHEQLNDEYGYSFGDRALQWITNISCNTLRNVDIFGRWSDSEFSIVLPETEIEGAGIIANRLVKLISDNSLEWQNNAVNVTISAGVAEFDSAKISLEEAMHCAGDALSLATEKGGNCTEKYQKE